MAIIVGEKVTHNYGNQTVLKDISFQVEPANRIGLVGPNGEGKTTLLRIIGRPSTRPSAASTGRRASGSATCRRTPLRLRNDGSRRDAPRVRRRAQARKGARDARPRDGREPRRTRTCSTDTGRSRRDLPPPAGTTIRPGYRRCSRGSRSSTRCGIGLSRSFPAGSARGRTSERCSSTARTCCCSTSRPITWTWRRSSGSNRGSTASTAPHRRLARPLLPRPRHDLDVGSGVATAGGLPRDRTAPTSRSARSGTRRF